jgi:purine-binding chemotaxis protein CheW
MTTLRNAATEEDKAARTAGRRQALVVFHLGQQAYAVPIDDVREIVPMARLSRPVGAPPLLAGLLAIGGQAIPAIHLSRLLEVPDSRPGLYTPLLILRAADHLLALVVERVSRIATVAEEAILPVRDNHSFNDCTIGIVNLDGQNVLLLSADRILLEQERECLFELESRKRERLNQLSESTS